MATDDSADRSRSSRRPRSDLGEEDEIEEGEFVAGSDTDDDTGYVLQHRRDDEGRQEIKRQRLGWDTVAVGAEGALPSPTPSSDCDSDGTISDIDADDAGAAALAPAERSFPCPVCRRGFRNKKAVCGHMRTHALHDPHRRRKGNNKERPAAFVPAISSGWAVTGKRGSVGGRSVSPDSQGVVDSMAIVIAKPVIDAMPIAFASKSSSAQPSPTNDESMAIVVASSHNAPDQNQIVMHHPTCSPQFNEAHQTSAPQVAVAQGQLAPAPPQILHPIARQVQRAAPPARDEQGWWICKEEGCNQRYATHQGLGGHMAGHKNRQLNEAAAAGLHLGVCDAAASARPQKLHYCKHCPMVFNAGVKLGGHMRKHYPGKVIPKKRGAGAGARTNESALGLSLTMQPAAIEAHPAVASVAQVAPVVPPGVLRIFGVNIVPAGPPAAAAAAAEEVPSAVSPAASARASAEEVSSTVPPAAASAEEVSPAMPPAAAAVEEVSSAVTETDQSSAASTNNIQEQ